MEKGRHSHTERVVQKRKGTIWFCIMQQRTKDLRGKPKNKGADLKLTADNKQLDVINETAKMKGKSYED